jgi:hypothetical protein
MSDDLPNKWCGLVLAEPVLLGVHKQFTRPHSFKVRKAVVV